MGKFSTYRYLELKDDTSAAHINVRSRTIKHPRRLKKVFIFLIVLALFVTYFLDSYISSYFKSRKVQNGKWHGHISAYHCFLVRVVRGAVTMAGRPRQELGLRERVPPRGHHRRRLIGLQGACL
ncbi:uncharacterized protein LOC113506531 isoform X3 [Trichoplusia ni]|uniref:Uncharacterized protein LOC113506531 isoform X3 n=1 Tax=Trichoplusia ni TaxID=7111 RepID=A0A7E5WY03_TRINI|nr:uncharacterized protein LOC113506531 isoform X3 [Trichoplusia ni]